MQASVKTYVTIVGGVLSHLGLVPIVSVMGGSAGLSRRKQGKLSLIKSPVSGRMRIYRLGYTSVFG
ncbi:MAG: hypothetical protein ACKO5Q_18020, partial [Microcystaceae cyanobacterium]